MNMAKPNFFIIGAAKAGTTSLHSYLSQHPEVFLPEIKEPNYFGIDRSINYRNTAHERVLFSKYNNDIEYYALYKEAEGFKAIGEASVATLYFPKAIHEIKQKLPCSKIIILLRNPVERAYSNYMHHVRDGYENMSFEDALNHEAEREKQNYTFGYQYRKVGLYANQLQNIYSEINPQKIKVILFEEFISRTDHILQEICKFLDVDPKFKFSTNYRLNKSGIIKPKSLRTWVLKNLISPDNCIKRLWHKIMPTVIKEKIHIFNKGFFINNNLKQIPMNPSTRKELQDYYREDVEKTAIIIQRDLSHWLSDTK